MRIDRVRLITEMAKNKVTQKELAKKCGCSRETIGLACRGIRCSDRTAEAISEVLHVNVKDLM